MNGTLSYGSDVLYITTVISVSYILEPSCEWIDYLFASSNECLAKKQALHIVCVCLHVQDKVEKNGIAQLTSRSAK